MFCFIGDSDGQTQPFNSGSTGADGALNITAPGVTYFNPPAMNLHPTNPNIFNFTTVTIAAGSTLKFTEEVFHGPVFFLVTGDVVINGILDLSGDAAVVATSQSQRQISYGGSGGFGGGLGGGPNNTPVPEPGNGPGGGGIGISGVPGGAGKFTGNNYLIPLVGGSGGGGAYPAGGCFGPSGGAGGGAILIASSASITVSSTGSIAATGGIDGYCNSYSGSGSGGAIRLVANTVTFPNMASSCGNPALSVGAVNANSGLIRIESFNTSQINSGCLAQWNMVISTPFSLVLPATAPGSIAVSAVNGVPINANPFSFPDTVINTSNPVVVNIQAQYIPPGTTPKLIVFSETGPDQIITCTPLAGTLQSSTSTASVTFPVGGSRGFVKATWTQ